MTLSHVCLRWVLLVGAVATASAQPPAGVRFDVPPGASAPHDAYVYGIVQDAIGYVWIASEDGLHRYDGVDFEPFRADPGRPGALPGNRVTGVDVDTEGAIWASVDRFGLIRVPAGGRQPERLPLPDVVTLNVTLLGIAHGHAWIRYEGSRADRTDYRPMHARVDLSTGRVMRLRTSVVGLGVAGGHVLATTSTAAAIYAGDGVWRRVLDASSPSLVAGDRLGVIVERNALFVFDGEILRREPLPLPESLRVPNLKLWLDGDVIWGFSQTRPGLVAYAMADGRITTYTVQRPDPVVQPSVTFVTTNDDGVTWVATGDGLRTITPGWSVFETTPLPPTEIAYLLAPGGDGRPWVAPVCRPLSRLSASGQMEAIAQTDPSLQRVLESVDACPSTVLEASDGSVWTGGWPAHQEAGVVRVNASGRATRYDDGRAARRGLMARHARIIHEDPRGRIWIATENGLARYLPEADSFAVYQAGPDRSTLGSSTIWQLADAPDGRLWVGMYTGGLALFDPDEERVVEHFRTDPGDASTLSSDIVTVIRPSRAEPNVVWVGTYDGGLNRLDVETGRVVRITRADGLPGLSIKSLLEDASGRLWLGTDAGLVRYTPADPSMQVYTESDGLPGVRFGLYDAVALPDGRFAFVVGDDLVTFDPDVVAPPFFDAAVVLRSIRVNGESAGRPLADGTIRLGAQERALGVEVAALSFAAPARIRYAAQLEGLDPEWVDLGTDRSSSWSRIPAGSYTLRVRAGTASGAWSSRELAVPVVVAAVWWERTWVQILLAMLVLVSFGVLVRQLAQRRLRMEVERLERQRESAQRLREERERISRDLHDHVGAQLSSLIAGVEIARLAGRAGGDGAPPDESHLDGLETDARVTMKRLRETIWALHDAAVTTGAFCERLRSEVRQQTHGRERPTITVTCSSAGDLAPAVALNLYRIAQEAIANAIKHADATSVTVTIAASDDSVDLWIRDDGSFDQGADETTERTVGTGFGIRSMRSRAEQLGGTLRMDSAEGTTVHASIPMTEATAKGSSYP
ncbi:MAG: two-component regulator propeller domain-containing protein [Bacteroidota bacterium]